MILEVSLGPVQGFVASSRRTRDLWTSSYLLSYLSGCLLLRARTQGGKIKRPKVDEDPLYAKLSDPEKPTPTIGTLPNHFLIEVEDEKEGRDVAEALEEELDERWQNMCQPVWTRYVYHAVSMGRGTKEIWDRQTRGFWDLTWVIRDDRDLSALRRRKAWRTHWPTPEGGDKCALLPDYQEISGYVRARPDEKERQRAFWSEIDKRLRPLDRREREYLSAPVMVKRLLPKVSKEGLGWELDASHWPSVAYMAAVPWLQKAKGLGNDHARLVEEILGEGGEDAFVHTIPPARSLKEEPVDPLARLDGDFVSLPSLQQLEVKKEDDEEGVSEEERKSLVRSLLDLNEAVGEAAPVFYAVLLADGDQLGRQLEERTEDEVGRALSKFTETAPRIVDRHDGVTVYAGGDDLLALLPLETSLECAASLRGAYESAWGDGDSGTISVAIVLAHVRAALGGVLDEARYLLDDVAKEENGRNSVAVSIYKRGGLDARWVSSWDRESVTGPRQAIALVGDLVGERKFSKSLAHRLEESLGSLCGWNGWEPGLFGELPQGLDDLGAFIRAELVRSLERTESDPVKAVLEADRITPKILDLLWESRSERANGAEKRIGLDGIILAHFLAGGGREEEHW